MVPELRTPDHRSPAGAPADAADTVSAAAGTTGSAVVARLTRTARWTLVRDGATVATAYAVCRPDRRWYVSVDAWDEADHEPLVNAMVVDLAHDLHTRIDGADPRSLELWSRFGFEPLRRELELLVPTDPGRTGLHHVVLPPGLVLLPADEVDERALRELDDQLRNELPGTDGWVSDPAEFHDHVFDEAHFDRATSLVAVDDERRQFAGLVRIWVSSTRSRLGILAVTRPYRRQGLARALLGSALLALHERGVVEVMAEVDASDAPGLALARRLGAVQTGSSLVLERRR